jgi:hypothetical protein
VLLGIDVQSLASNLLLISFALVVVALAYGLVEQPVRLVSARLAESSPAVAPPQRDSGPAVPWPIAVIGGVLVLWFIALTIEAYSGRFLSDLLTALAPRNEVLASDSASVALLDSTGAATPRVGQLVLDGRTGQLRRIQSDGAISVTAASGQRLRVQNVGPWDQETAQLGGLDATYDGRRWVVDASTMLAANSNSDLRVGSAADPIPGFWVSPGDSGYRVSRGEEDNRPHVRIEATRAGAYLVLNAQEPLAKLQGVPVAVRGQVRGKAEGETRLTLYEVVADDGRAETRFVRATLSEQNWTTLVLNEERMLQPNASNNYSLGLTDVRPGEWFEVRELSLFVGRLPEP